MITTESDILQTTRDVLAGHKEPGALQDMMRNTRSISYYGRSPAYDALIAAAAAARVDVIEILYTKLEILPINICFAPYFPLLAPLIHNQETPVESRLHALQWFLDRPEFSDYVQSASWAHKSLDKDMINLFGNFEQDHAWALIPILDSVLTHSSTLVHNKKREYWQHKACHTSIDELLPQLFRFCGRDGKTYNPHPANFLALLSYINNSYVSSRILESVARGEGPYKDLPATADYGVKMKALCAQMIVGNHHNVMAECCNTAMKNGNKLIADFLLYDCYTADTLRPAVEKAIADGETESLANLMPFVVCTQDKKFLTAQQGDKPSLMKQVNSYKADDMTAVMMTNIIHEWLMEDDDTTNGAPSYDQRLTVYDGRRKSGMSSGEKLLGFFLSGMSAVEIFEDAKRRQLKQILHTAQKSMKEKKPNPPMRAQVTQGTSPHLLPP